MQQRLPKFKRVATALLTRRITERTIAVLALLERYRFLPTSLILLLAGGDHRTTASHLQLLFHRGFVNRFAFSLNSEMVYYLDNPEALKLLLAESTLSPESVDWNIVRYNRDREYGHRDDPGRKAFVLHELS